VLLQTSVTMQKTALAHQSSPTKGRYSMPTSRTQSPGSSHRRRVPILYLCLGLVIVLAGSGAWLTTGPLSVHASPLGKPTPVPRASSRKTHPVSIPAVGYAYFLSTEQINRSMTQGVNDEIELDLHGLAAPTPGTAYYSWLLGDEGKTLFQPLLLGQLQVLSGKAHLLYQDPGHTDLLSSRSRILITQESAAFTPQNPSLDQRTWRYYGALSPKPDPADTQEHYSVLDHVRHLLTNVEVMAGMSTMHLQGGLRLAFYMNARKVFEWAVAARGITTSERAGLLRRHLYRILDYLDGSMVVMQDVPAGTPLYVDPETSAIGLLQLKQQQDPTGIVVDIGLHLAALAHNPTAAPVQRDTAIAVTANLDAVAQELAQARQDALHLLALDDAQLQGPAALPLLNDLVEQSGTAYSGTLDAQTGERRGGVLWITDQLGRLGAIAIGQV
jgi:hypothetical protein